MSGPSVATQRLRLSDSDPLGHVNNATYATLFEAGRTEMLYPLGLIAGTTAAVIVRLEIDFVKEMNWPGDVRIETGVLRFGTKSLHLRQRLLMHGEVTARAASVLAFIDSTARRAIPLKPEWCEALTNYRFIDDAVT